MSYGWLHAKLQLVHKMSSKSYGWLHAKLQTSTKITSKSYGWLHAGKCTTITSKSYGWLHASFLVQRDVHLDPGLHTFLEYF